LTWGKEIRVLTFVRFAAAAVLLLIVAGCAYLALAAREAPPESWWAYWYIYALVGVPALWGAGRLLWPKRPLAT
jgi:hypothetical protein